MYWIQLSIVVKYNSLISLWKSLFLQDRTKFILLPTPHQLPTKLYVFGLYTFQLTTKFSTCSAWLLPFCFLLLHIGANHGSVNIIHFSSLRHTYLFCLYHLLSILLHLFIHTVSFISLECNCFIVKLCQPHNNYPPCQTVFPTISSVVFFSYLPVSTYFDVNFQGSTSKHTISTNVIGEKEIKLHPTNQNPSL